MTELINQLTYDLKSPSGLVWAEDIWAGSHGKILRVAAGTAAGSKSDVGRGSFRWYIRSKRKSYLVHRLIWEMHFGPVPPGLVIDHIDGDSLNNDITNLRAITQQANTENSRRRSNAPSPVTGVRKVGKKRANGTTSFYWIASYRARDTAKEHIKHFSVGVLGEDEAFKQACAYRENGIKELNAQGAQYTERHGK